MGARDRTADARTQSARRTSRSAPPAHSVRAGRRRIRPARTRPRRPAREAPWSQPPSSFSLAIANLAGLERQIRQQPLHLLIVVRRFKRVLLRFERVDLLLDRLALGDETAHR